MTNDNQAQAPHPVETNLVRFFSESLTFGEVQARIALVEGVVSSVKAQLSEQMKAAEATKHNPELVDELTKNADAFIEGLADGSIPSKKPDAKI